MNTRNGGFFQFVIFCGNIMYLNESQTRTRIIVTYKKAPKMEAKKGKNTEENERKVIRSNHVDAKCHSNQFPSGCLLILV